MPLSPGICESSSFCRHFIALDLAVATIVRGAGRSVPGHMPMMTTIEASHVGFDALAANWVPRAGFEGTLVARGLEHRPDLGTIAHTTSTIVRTTSTIARPTSG